MRNFRRRENYTSTIGSGVIKIAIALGSGGAVGSGTTPSAFDTL